MTKKKGTFLTLALAGAIAVSGSIVTQAGMTHNIQEEQVIQVEQKQETLQEMVQEESEKEDAKNQVWQEKESIYLPEGAEIVARDEEGYKIVWDNCSIKYLQNFVGLEKETQEDLGLAKLMPIIKDTIKKYSGQDMGKCEIELYLVGLEGDFEGGEDCEPIVLTDEELAAFENEMGAAGEERLYDIASKGYHVVISFDKHDYFIGVDSVTGEVYEYYYANNNLGGFSNGWEMVESYDPVYELSEEVQKEYDAWITSFVTNNLKLGKVEKVFAQNWGLAYIENGNNDVRAYYSALCKTENGKIVEVSVDMGEKMVTGFTTTVEYSSEE